MISFKQLFKSKHPSVEFRSGRAGIRSPTVLEFFLLRTNRRCCKLVRSWSSCVIKKWNFQILVADTRWNVDVLINLSSIISQRSMCVYDEVQREKPSPREITRSFHQITSQRLMVSESLTQCKRSSQLWRMSSLRFNGSQSKTCTFNAYSNCGRVCSLHLACL